MEMTPKQRLLAAIRGEEVDHVPFSPFLAYYFESLPQEIQKQGQFRYLQEMGADPLLRGGVQAYTVEHGHCTIDSYVEGRKRYEIFHTKYGDLSEEFTYVPEGNTWFLTKHMIDSVDQIPALIDYYEDMIVVEKIKEANEAVAQLGEAGLYSGMMTANGKSAYQFMVENLIGTVNLVYMTMDDPDKIGELVDVMARKNLETVEISAKSDIEVFTTWEDSSTTNLSPTLYSTYVQPEITRWCQILRDAGKNYVQHACGHIKDLLPLMDQQGVTGVESISPAPTGNIRMKDVFKTLPEHVSLIGGIEPTQILNDSVEDLLEYSEDLIRSRGNRGLVLANSDSCPPGVQYEKFVRLARLVKEIH